jgi:hypothetical protein
MLKINFRDLYEKIDSDIKKLDIIRENIIDYENKILELYDSNPESNLLLKNNTIDPTKINIEKFNNSETFKYNFDIITENIFDTWDFPNCIVLGDICFQSLLKNNSRDRFYFLPDKLSEIYIYFYGITYEKLSVELDKLFNLLKKKMHVKLEFYEDDSFVVIKSKFPYRTIFISKNIYQSKDQILLSQNIDCKGIGFDGTNILISQKCLLSLYYFENYLSLDRYVEHYDNEIIKYNCMDFNFNFPEKDLLPDTIYDNNIGYAKILSANNSDRFINFRNYDSKNITNTFSSYKYSAIKGIDRELFLSGLFITTELKNYFIDIVNKKDIEIYNDNIDHTNRNSLELAISFNNNHVIQSILEAGFEQRYAKFYACKYRNYGIQARLDDNELLYNKMNIDQFKVIFLNEHNNLYPNLNFAFNEIIHSDLDTDLFINNDRYLQILLNRNIKISSDPNIILNKELLVELLKKKLVGVNLSLTTLLKLSNRHIEEIKNIIDKDSLLKEIDSEILNLSYVNLENISFIDAINSNYLVNINRSTHTIEKILKLKNLLYPLNYSLVKKKFNIETIKFFNLYSQNIYTNTKILLRFYGSIWNDNEEVIDSFLNTDNINSKLQNGITPFHLSVIKNNLNIMKKIINHDDFDLEQNIKELNISEIIFINNSFECYSELLDRSYELDYNLILEKLIEKNQFALIIKTLDMKKYTLNSVFENIVEQDNKIAFLHFLKISDIDKCNILEIIFDCNKISRIEYLKILNTIIPLIHTNFSDRITNKILNDYQLLQFIMDLDVDFIDTIPNDSFFSCSCLKSFKYLIEQQPKYSDIIKDNILTIIKIQLIKNDQREILEFLNSFGINQLEKDSLGNTICHYAITTSCSDLYELNGVENNNGKIPYDILCDMILSYSDKKLFDDRFNTFLNTFNTIKDKKIDRIYYEP